MDGERIRLRLHWGGKFQESGSDCRYVGGEVFNESVPREYKYADLCLKLNDKVGYTCSIKYQAPGEELNQNELVSVSGDDDLEELYDEYMQALRRPGTAKVNFRIKIFLFPALQDELDTEARPVEPLQEFDPEEWDGPLEDDSQLYEGDPAVMAAPSVEPSGMQMQWQLAQVQPNGYAQLQPGLPLALAPADRAALGGPLAPEVGAVEHMDRQALGNLLQSVSRSAFMQRPKRGITEEIDLMDPYHEDEDRDDMLPLRLGQRQAQRADGWHGWSMQPGQEQEQKPLNIVWAEGKVDPEANGHSSLVGNLPSHISAFGAQGGRALSAGADDAVGLGHDAAADPLGLNGKPTYEFPSHISIFGSSTRWPEDADMADQQPGAHVEDAAGGGHPGERRNGNYRTQEFSRDASLTHAGPDLGLPDGGDFEDDGSGFQPLSTPKILDEVVKVPIDEVHTIRKIGEGAFGEVSFANVQSHGLVAVKWLKRDRFAKYSESFMREAEVLAKLNHPNIIRMYGVVIEPVEKGFVGSTVVDVSSGGSSNASSRGQPPAQQCIIVGIMTDFVRGGSLSGQLRAAKRRPTLKERCQVAVQAARGMAFLHAQNPAVIHFDLKPDNLLVDGDGETLHVKVADFGLSKHKFQTFISCRDLRGTLPYMAPELVSKPNQVSEKCDVWSMGVVMWEMYTLEVPYREMSAQQILMALMHGNIHLHVPSSCEPEWRGLIEMCMDLNPAARPSFKQLTTHLDALLWQLY